MSRIGFEGIRQDAYRTRFAEKCYESMSNNEQENPCRVWVCGYTPAVDNPLIFPHKEEVGGSSPSTPTGEMSSFCCEMQYHQGVSPLRAKGRISIEAHL